MKGDRLIKQVEALCDKAASSRDAFHVMTDEELDEYFRKQERKQYRNDYLLMVAVAAIVCGWLWWTQDLFR